VFIPISILTERAGIASVFRACLLKKSALNHDSPPFSGQTNGMQVHIVTTTKSRGSFNKSRQTGISGFAAHLGAKFRISVPVQPPLY
jgi:hypothetical protein